MAHGDFGMEMMGLGWGAHRRCLERGDGEVAEDGSVDSGGADSRASSV